MRSRARPARAVPGYLACVIDDAGQPLPRGQVGRLAVKGPTGCRYLADERQAEYVQNGWNLTGDAYLVDDDGYFVYQARTDDMIISGGYNIAGPEVESALLLHPQGGRVRRGRRARRGARPDRQGLRRAAAGRRAVRRAGAASCRTSSSRPIAPYKYPRAIEFRASLPRTETGKLQRFRLRQGS